jgi:transcription elongation GreA/GreB family factor
MSAGPELIVPARDGEAEIGERVTVLDLTTSEVRDHRLVEAPEYVADGEVSIRAPLGSALLGRHVGDVVSVEGLQLEIVEIDG